MKDHHQCGRAEGVQYIIFSTLPHVAQNSGAKYQKVDHFDAKAEVEGYMRGLPTIRSIFYAQGWFIQSFNRHMAPRRMPDKVFVIVNIVSLQTKLPLIDPYEAGKWPRTPRPRDIRREDLIGCYEALLVRRSCADDE